MAIRDLVPWNRNRAVDVPRSGGDPFGSLHRDMTRLVEDFARSFEVGSLFGSDGFAPRIDVREDENELLVTAEIPGLEEKDFTLELREDALTLRGEKRLEHEEQTGSMHRTERSYGRFERAVPLPCEVNADKSRATYRNGVLTVTLPKAESARRRIHRIDVKSR